MTADTLCCELLSKYPFYKNFNELQCHDGHCGWIVLWDVVEELAKHTQHFNVAQHVAHVWSPSCNMLQHVGWFLEVANRTSAHDPARTVAKRVQHHVTSKNVEHFQTWSNTIQHRLEYGGQTCPTCCAQCCAQHSMLCWAVRYVACVWSSLYAQVGAYGGPEEQSNVTIYCCLFLYFCFVMYNLITIERFVLARWFHSFVLIFFF